MQRTTLCGNGCGDGLSAILHKQTGSLTVRRMQEGENGNWAHTIERMQLLPIDSKG